MDVSRLLRNWNVHVTHPRYFGLFNPSVRQAGLVADALVALYNPQLAVWSHAPVANEIERLTLRTFTKALGVDPETILANFTSGGTEANFSAVLAALIQRFPGVAESGVAGLPSRPAIYLTSESHHSFVKIARMTGLGTNGCPCQWGQECFFAAIQKPLNKHLPFQPPICPKKPVTILLTHTLQPRSGRAG